MIKNETASGHSRLHTHPEEMEDKRSDDSDEDSRYQELVFAHFHDLAGQIRPTTYEIHDPAQDIKHEIKVAGIAGLKSYLKILREKYGARLQVVSSGQLFSPYKSFQEMLFYLNYLGIDVNALAKSEFMLNLQDPYITELDKQFAPSNFPTIASNIFNLAQGEPQDFKHIRKNVILSAGPLRVGYISTVSLSTAKALDPNKLQKLYFQPMLAEILEQSNTLRKNGADVIALIVANGMDCTSQLAQSKGISEYKTNFDPHNQNVCDTYQNELAKLLGQLPVNKVDIVFTNGMNSKIANFIQGHPVLQNFANGQYLSWARLVYDNKLKRVDKEQTRIYQPIHLCHQFFKETEDCYPHEVGSFLSPRNIEIVPAKFLGKEVQVQQLPTHK